MIHPFSNFDFGGETLVTGKVQSHGSCVSPRRATSPVVNQCLPTSSRKVAMWAEEQA